MQLVLGKPCSGRGYVFEDGCQALASADAHCLKPVGRVASFHLADARVIPPVLAAQEERRRGAIPLVSNGGDVNGRGDHSRRVPESIPALLQVTEHRPRHCHSCAILLMFTGKGRGPVAGRRPEERWTAAAQTDQADPPCLAPCGIKSAELGRLPVASVYFAPCPFHVFLSFTGPTVTWITRWPPFDGPLNFLAAGLAGTVFEPR